MHIDTGSGGYGGWYPTIENFHQGADGKTWILNAPSTYTLEGLAEVTIQEMEFDPDPLVYNNILVNNISGVNQIFSIGVILPVPGGWPAPNLIRGSIDTSLIGINATVSTIPTISVYQAQIDGATVRTLQDHPFSLSTPNNASSGPMSFGYEINNVAVVNTIGILLTFELTPGDTVAILSDFEIIAVPEPSSLALLLVGGSILALRRQRR